MEMISAITQRILWKIGTLATLLKGNVNYSYPRISSTGEKQRTSMPGSTFDANNILTFLSKFCMILEPLLLNLWQIRFILKNIVLTFIMLRGTQQWSIIIRLDEETFLNRMVIWVSSLQTRFLHDFKQCNFLIIHIHWSMTNDQWPCSKICSSCRCLFVTTIDKIVIAILLMVTTLNPNYDLLQNTDSQTIRTIHISLMWRGIIMSLVKGSK